MCYNNIVSKGTQGYLSVVVDKETDTEKISWQEPPTFKWENKSKLNIEIDKPGRFCSLIRTYGKPLTNELLAFYN